LLDEPDSRLSACRQLGSVPADSVAAGARLVMPVRSLATGLGTALPPIISPPVNRASVAENVDDLLPKRLGSKPVQRYRQVASRDGGCLVNRRRIEGVTSSAYMCTWPDTSVRTAIV